MPELPDAKEKQTHKHDFPQQKRKRMAKYGMVPDFSG